MGMVVLAEARMLGLVEHRQVEIGEVHQFGVEATMGRDPLMDPAGDLRPHPAGARACDDGLQRQGHVCLLAMVRPPGRLSLAREGGYSL